MDLFKYPRAQAGVQTVQRVNGTPEFQIPAHARKGALLVPKRSLGKRTKPWESMLPICSPRPRQPTHHCGKGGLTRCRASKARPSSIHFSWKCLRFCDSSLIPYAILSLYFHRHRAGCLGQHPLQDGEGVALTLCTRGLGHPFQVASISPRIPAIWQESQFRKSENRVSFFFFLFFLFFNLNAMGSPLTSSLTSNNELNF